LVLGSKKNAAKITNANPIMYSFNNVFIILMKPPPVLSYRELSALSKCHLSLKELTLYYRY
ncbi:MAG: hypothetical protein RSD92_05945, partial [Erysipelotrichaceae bacterium]